jgi:hypothetical protein
MTNALPQLAAVAAFLAPAPISPLFQNGGKFQGWNEDISLVAFFIVMLGLLDKVLVTPLLRDKVNAPAPCACANATALTHSQDKSDKTRYFALHAIANAISAYAALPDVIRAFTQVPSSTLRTLNPL